MTFSRQHIFAPNPSWPSAHAASVAHLPDDRLMASWFAGSREGAPDTAVWCSEFGSNGWSPPHRLVDTPGCSDGNSVLWLDEAERLRLWYVTMEGQGWATCVVRERRSEDGGRSWGADKTIKHEWGWMVRNEPVHCNGSTVMPMYDERDWSAFVLVSEDGGETWSQSNVVRANVGIIQPALASLGDRLLMFLRSRGGVIYRSLSLDPCGRVWSDPEPTALPNPNSAVELIRLASSSLLAAFNPSARDRSPLRIALSDDNGERWTTWRDLETGPGEFSYPTATQTPDGLIHVLYTNRRRTITHTCFDEPWVRGAD